MPTNPLAPVQEPLAALRRLLLAPTPEVMAQASPLLMQAVEAMRGLVAGAAGDPEAQQWSGQLDGLRGELAILKALMRHAAEFFIEQFEATDAGRVCYDGTGHSIEA